MSKPRRRNDRAIRTAIKQILEDEPDKGIETLDRILFQRLAKAEEEQRRALHVVE